MQTWMTPGGDTPTVATSSPAQANVNNISRAGQGRRRNTATQKGHHDTASIKLGIRGLALSQTSKDQDGR